MSTSWQRRGIVLGLCVLLTQGLTGLAISAIEARKEIRVLCGMMRPGRSLDSVVQMLETTQWSTWTLETAPGGVVIRMSSRLDLRSMRCEVNFEDAAMRTARLED